MGGRTRKDGVFVWELLGDEADEVLEPSEQQTEGATRG